jgi:ankyrin repeat protein
LHHQNSPLGGWTVLHECLRRPAPQQRELVAALIAKGADVNADIHEDTAIDESQRDYNYWSADDAPERDPSRTLICGCTPLFLATVGAGDMECMKLLLAAGAETNVRIWGSVKGDLFDPYEDHYLRCVPKSPLICIFLHLWEGMFCISSEDVNATADRIYHLLQYGARIDAGGSDDETADYYSPLRLACRRAIEKGYALLDLLLDSADKTNASLEYREEVRGVHSLDLEYLIPMESLNEYNALLIESIQGPTLYCNC